ncbi:MAG: SpoIID/LytB domain-containing protein [Synergistaceae bacterium]|nr:SpoIID/LytB domain-containing protein [Synergistaceae bacterium]
MFKKLFAVIILILSLNISIAEARDIYVKLGGGSANIASDGDMILSSNNAGAVPLGRSASLNISGSNVNVNGRAFALPVRITSSSLLKFNGRSYRGSFVVTQKAGLLNVLDLELYLRGVLPAEVGAAWPMEALRAQAIISRTYVLRQSINNRANKGYDVVDTDSDQVYKGADVETAKTNQAVASTAGEIVAYNKTLAFTPFHSDSGGYTASNADVWGKSFPYLQGVPEAVEYKSPVSSWSVKISRSHIAKSIAKIAGNLGSIIEVRVTETDAGGRAIGITVVGTKGRKTMKASQFRLAVGPRLLKSTMLTPYATGSSNNNKNNNKSKAQVIKAPELSITQGQKLAQMTAAGVFTSTEMIDMLTNPERENYYYKIGLERSSGGKNLKPVPDVRPMPSFGGMSGGFSVAADGEDFIFYGKGWGHGVGLSQWGSQAMAQKGWTAEKILTHYYPGTNITGYK